MEHSIPTTIEELKKKRKQIMKSMEAKKKTSLLGRIALWITAHVGSMGFFVIIFIWTVGWLNWNIFAPKNLRFDPFPGFPLYILCLYFF